MAYFKDNHSAARTKDTPVFNGMIFLEILSFNKMLKHE
jgi:hypothetical protein